MRGQENWWCKKTGLYRSDIELCTSRTFWFTLALIRMSTVQFNSLTLHTIFDPLWMKTDAVIVMHITVVVSQEFKILMICLNVFIYNQTTYVDNAFRDRYQPVNTTTKKECVLFI